MTGVDKLELPQFSIVDIRLVSREVRFTTGEAANLVRLHKQNATQSSRNVAISHTSLWGM